MAKAAKKNELVRAEVAPLLPAVFSPDDAALGGEVGAADLALPLLIVLQGLSWALDRTKPNYIEGAAAGDIALTVLNEHWDGRKGVDVVFCHYSRWYDERQPTELGGNKVATHVPEAPIVRQAQRNDMGKLMLPSGNQLVETAYHAMLVWVDDQWVRAVMPMAGTKIKISKKMNSILTALKRPDGHGHMVGAARWYRVFRMLSATESRLGKTWNVPVFEILEEPVDEATYALGKEWAIAAGKMNEKFPVAEEAQLRQKEEEF